MLELVNSYDHIAMLLLNFGEYHTPCLDFFFFMVSQIAVWIPVVLVFLFTIFKNKGREGFLILGVVVILFLLCDQISSGLLKPLLARPRPSHDPSIETALSYVFNYKGGAFGFPSSHAANSFGFAVFSALLLRNRFYTVVSLIWAILCSYSRIYLGVHFPCDILVGTIIGVAIAFLCYFCYELASRRWLGEYYYGSKEELTTTGYAKKDIYWIVYSLVSILFVCFFCGLKFPVNY